MRGDTEDARVFTWSAQDTSSSALVSAARDLLTDNGVKRRVRRGEKTAACVRLALVHAAAVQRARMEGRGRNVAVVDLGLLGALLLPTSSTGPVSPVPIAGGPDE